MKIEIKVINLGGVNCYLLKAGEKYILVDTGFSNKRTQLVEQLEEAGCSAGNLNLIILTHGDLDHAANAAFLREKFGAKIAIHPFDSGMVEKGDMGWNRKSRPDRISLIGLMIIMMGQLTTILNRSNRFEKFKPDIYLENGQSLIDYGLDASVIYLPGHSKGSIGI